MPPDPLARVKRAATSKRRADESYRAALVVAHEAGHDYGEIARAAGTTRQAARQLIERTTKCPSNP